MLTKRIENLQNSVQTPEVKEICSKYLDKIAVISGTVNEKHKLETAIQIEILKELKEVLNMDKTTILETFSVNPLKDWIINESLLCKLNNLGARKVIELVKEALDNGLIANPSTLVSFKELINAYDLPEYRLIPGVMHCSETIKFIPGIEDSIKIVIENYHKYYNEIVILNHLYELEYTRSMPLYNRVYEAAQSFLLHKNDKNKKEVFESANCIVGSPLIDNLKNFISKIDSKPIFESLTRVSTNTQLYKNYSLIEAIGTGLQFTTKLGTYVLENKQYKPTVTENIVYKNINGLLHSKNTLIERNESGDTKITFNINAPGLTPQSIKTIHLIESKGNVSLFVNESEADLNAFYSGFVVSQIGTEISNGILGIYENLKNNNSNIVYLDFCKTLIQENIGVDILQESADVYTVCLYKFGKFHEIHEKLNGYKVRKYIFETLKFDIAEEFPEFKTEVEYKIQKYNEQLIKLKENIEKLSENKIKIKKGIVNLQNMNKDIPSEILEAYKNIKEALELSEKDYYILRRALSDMQKINISEEVTIGDVYNYKGATVTVVGILTNANSVMLQTESGESVSVNLNDPDLQFVASKNPEIDSDILLAMNVQFPHETIDTK